MKKKAVYVTPINIFDKRKNGGANLAISRRDMLLRYFGKENVFTIVFTHPDDETMIEQEDNVVVMPKICGNIKLLIASFFGCRVYMPWDEKKILRYIDNIEPDLVFFESSIEGKLLNFKKNYKTVVAFQNMEADFTYNKVKDKGFIYYPAYWAAKRNDRWAVGADGVICLNDRDSSRLFELYKRNADVNIPVTFYDQFCETKAQKNYKRELLFLGSLFGPNVDVPTTETTKMNISVIFNKLNRNVASEGSMLRGNGCVPQTHRRRKHQLPLVTQQ